MDRRIILSGLLFALLFCFVLNVSATSIIVLNDSVEKVYALEKVTLYGDVESNELDITGSGEALSGENVKVYLFGPASDVLVHGVYVNNKATTVSFDDKGYFFLVSSEGSFSFKGKLSIRTIGQIRLQVPGPMNELDFNLLQGYAIGGTQYGLYKDEVVIQRAEKVSMLVDGAFRYTYAERNQFYYVINFKAFGSTLGQYTINLKNSETVTSVSGALKWEQSGSKLVLDLESDKATVVVQGLFDSTSLKIPLTEDRHHVLIESDPEKKITVETYAQEVDLTESPLSAQYSNARAFLASKDDVFRITVKDLTVLPSLAAAVSSATNKIAVTSKGSVLGELVYSYANTGVDYIEVDIGDATPLYASTDRQAVKLTKEDKLLLSFPKTKYGTLDLVYFTTRNAISPVDVITIPLAKSELPITEATTQIYLPEDYYVVETLGAPGGSELPSAYSVIIFAIVVGAIGYLLKKDPKLAILYIVLTYGLMTFSMGLFLLIIAGSLALIARQFLSGKSLAVIVGAGLVLAVVLMVLGAFAYFILEIGGMGGPVDTIEYRGDYAMVEKAAMAPSFNAMETIGSGEGAISVPTREGVYPVKLELPELGKTITVKNYLVTKENQVELQVVLVAGYIKYLLYLVSLLAGIGCVGHYNR